MTTTKNQKRDMIGCNPPYGANVVTNVAKHFLSVLDKHFLPHNKFHKIFYRNTLKISYSCIPNMKRTVNSHIHKITNSKTTTKEKICNYIEQNIHLAKTTSLTASFTKQYYHQTTLTTKKKAALAKLKLHSSFLTQTTKSHLNFQNTKQILNYPTKCVEWKSLDKNQLSRGK